MLICAMMMLAQHMLSLTPSPFLCICLPPCVFVSLTLYLSPSLPENVDDKMDFLEQNVTEKNEKEEIENGLGETIVAAFKYVSGEAGPIRTESSGVLGADWSGCRR